MDAVFIAFKASPVWAVLRFLLTLIQSLMPTVAMTFAMAGFIDTANAILQNERPHNDIYLPLFLMLLVLSILTTIGAVIALVTTRINLDISRKLKPAIVKKCASLEFKHIENSSSWELISRVSRDPVQAVMNGFNGFMQMQDITISIVGVLIVIVTQVWWAALIIIAFSTPMFWLSIRAGKKNYQASRDNEKYKRRAEYLDEVLTGRENIDERTLFGYSEHIGKRWMDQYEISRKRQLKVRARMFLITKGASLIQALIAVLVALTLINPVINGDLTAGMFLGIVTAAFNMIMQLGWKMSASLESISHVNEYMKDLTEFWDLSQAEGANLEPDPEPIIFSKLEFRNVRFKYPTSEHYILDGLSFLLECGFHYAFVGKNGAGKTTIAKLLTGLYTEYEGEILINDKELRTYPASTIKALISVIYQDFAKYYISLKDNIILGDVADQKAVLRALPAMGLAGVDFAGLNDGYDTPLGKIKEGGQDLSGGQWQRVAIARSLISRAPIKILDEPTAALDPISESKLYNDFEKLMRGKTTLFISHRLGSTKLADQILVVDSGKIVEQGTHIELMELSGQYAEMFESQRNWYK